MAEESPSKQHSSRPSLAETRTWSRSPRPYRRARLRNDDVEGADGRLGRKTSNLTSTSGSEADDESAVLLRGLPCPPLASRKGLRGMHEACSEDQSSPLRLPVFLNGVSKRSSTESRPRTMVGEVRASNVQDVARKAKRFRRRRRMELTRRGLEAALLGMTGAAVLCDGGARQRAGQMYREIICMLSTLMFLFLLYPLRLLYRMSPAAIAGAFRSGHLVRVPSSFDPAPLLYPIFLPVYIAFSIPSASANIITSNFVISLSAIPTQLVPGACYGTYFSAVHWALASTPLLPLGPLFRRLGIPLPVAAGLAKESNADYYLFLFPLHQVLLPVLRDLARTSLLPAETQLLAIGLVNLLIHAVSPQAVTLTALLWGGGLGILVLCRPVLRWGITLARIPRWRFRRAEPTPRVSKILSNVLRLRLSEKAPSMGDSDADEDGPPGLRRRAESLGAKPEPGLLRSVGVPAAIESAHQASLAWNPSCPSVQVHRMTSVPHQAVFGHPRSYTFSAADRWNVRHRQLGENGVARWHQHRVPLFVQSFLSLTPAQALLRKWLYAAYVYVVTAMIIFMGIGVYVKDYALQGRDPIGWALGYLFGDLPWVRDGISALSGARWLCRSSPWTEEGQEEVRSGPAEYIRQVYLGPGNTRLLVMVYLAAVVVGGMAVVLQLRDAVEVDTRRKVFHGMMVVMFLPAIFVDPVFAGFAMMLVLAVFLLLEVLRASQLPPLSKPLAAFLTPYVDGRDLRGPVVVSHMFLLIGCAVPLWLSLARLPRTGTGCERGWEVPRREMGMVSGVICVGMGDAAASLVGRRWGRHKWPWPGGKSLEGSLAFFVAVVTGLRIARAWAWTGGWFHSDVVRVNDLMKLTTAAGAASLTEAVLTGGNDNVIVPIILWLLVVGLNI